MTLESGVRLGPYEIVDAIGAGGMGEVYKAKDTRLDRTVALKVLPEHLASNPEFRQRLEREAKEQRYHISAPLSPGESVWSVEDQAVEVGVFPVEVPAEVHAAVLAAGEPPAKSREPAVGRLPVSRDRAAERLREAADVEPDTDRVGEVVGVAAIHLHARSQPCHHVGTAGAVDVVPAFVRGLLEECLEPRIEGLTLFVEHVDHDLCVASEA